jgi:hypothetical protein
MSKRIMTVVASLVAALVGSWLILAPFALGYFHVGAAWNRPTEVDFWTGVGVVVAALVALAASLSSIRTELRIRGALPATLSREEAQERRAAMRAAKASARAAKAAARAGQASVAAGHRSVAGHAGVVGLDPPGSGAGQGLGAPPTSAELRELLAPLVVALLSDLGSSEADNPSEPQASNQAGNHLSGPEPRTTPRSWS